MKLKKKKIEYLKLEPETNVQGGEKKNKETGQEFECKVRIQDYKICKKMLITICVYLGD